jgi:hypothetical protein
MKRKLGGLLSDPLGNISLGNTRMAEDMNAFTALADEAGLLPGSRSVLVSPQQRQNALAQLAQRGTEIGANMVGATVYHGSPHKFNKFDSSNIGMGEGTQMQGHGIYVATNKDVAEGYAGWTPIKIDGRPVRYGLPNKGNNANLPLVYDGPINHLARAELSIANHPDDAIKALKNSIESTRKKLSLTSRDEMEIRNMTGALDWIEKNHDRIQGTYVYKAEMPDEIISKMLNWDNGGDKLWRAAVAKSGSPKSAAEALKSEGITGIRYLDGGSRGAGGGTSNYVVFPGNESLLKILERNGVPLP